MRRLGMVCVLAGVTAPISCVAPSDQSGQLRVTIEPIPNLLPNDTIQAVAHVLDQTGGEIPGVAFRFATSDPTVAGVTPTGQVFATGIGVVKVLAWVPGLQRVSPAQTTTVVHGAIEIDSVRPGRVRYGSHLQIYGIGLDPSGAATANTGGLAAPIVSYTPADSVHPERYGVLGVVVVPPLGQNSDEVVPIDVPITITTTHGAATITAPLIIEPRDIYEPNDSTPTDLGVISQRFEALGLAFDRLDGTAPSLAVDWYKFTTAARGDWTITLKGVDAFGSYPQAYLVNGPLTYTTANPFGVPVALWYIDRPNLPTIGMAESCDGFFGAFDPLANFANLPIYSFPGVLWTAKKKKMTWALKNLPPGEHHLLVGYNFQLSPWPGAPGSSPVDTIIRSALAAVIAPFSSSPLRYDLIIQPGIHTDLPPDRYEDNDNCDNAPTLLSLDSTAFADSIIDNLSLDVEFDYDWYVIQSHAPGRLYLSVESDNLDQQNAPILLSPFRGAGQSVTLMNLEGYGADWEGQDLRSWREGGVLGVALSAGSYYLHLEGGTPRSYRMRFSWVPSTAIASLAMAPDSARVQVGTVLSPRVTLKDASGNSLPGIYLSWRTSPAGVIDVATTGEWTAVGVGSATIIATSNGRSDSSTVTVEPGCGANPIVNCILTPLSPTLEPYFRSAFRYSGGDSATSITFTNSSAQSISVYWLDYIGQRQLFNTLAPGQSYLQSTFTDNPWLVTDSAGTGLALYYPVSVDAQAVIN